MSTADQRRALGLSVLDATEGKTEPSAQLAFQLACAMLTLQSLSAAGVVLADHMPDAFGMKHGWAALDAYQQSTASTSETP